MKNLWYHNAVFYGMDVRRFQDSNGDGFGDLPGLISRLDYLVELGITALWMLPFFDTPLRDNGYDIRDYYRVDPRVGTLDDFLELVEQAHRRGIRILIDLVMNHTSDQHPWFQAARRSPHSLHHNYYVWTRELPEETLGGGTIFPGEEDSVWTHDPVAQAYYYHRFYHFQPGLRVGNPSVQEEIHKTVDFWLALGVDGFRFDAAPIMIQTKGLKETEPDNPHGIFQSLHGFIVQRNPEAALLAEANVEIEQLDEFFGGGSEMNMLFSFLLGPHILLALARGSAQPVHDYLEKIPVPPEEDQWLNFLRNHDEFTMEVMSKEDQEALFEAYAPEEHMRIYDRGIRRRLAPMLAGPGSPLHRPRTELAFSLMFSMPGTPLFMYGDELGMGDDLSLPGREAVRVPMQWSAEKNAGFSTAEKLFAPVVAAGPFAYPKVNAEAQMADPGSFRSWIKQLIAARHACPEIGSDLAELLEPEDGDPRVLAHCYPDENGESLLFCHNLSAEERNVRVPWQGTRAEILFGNGEVSEENGKVRVRLPGYGYVWVRG